MDPASVLPVEHEAVATPPATDGVRSPAARLSWKVFAALIFLPALGVLWLIFQYGVNIPHYDQWTAMAPLFQAMEAGKLGWQDFTAQHNEHRLPLPRLVFFAVGWLTHWDTRAEMVLTVLVLVTAAGALWKLLDATGWRACASTYGLFVALAALVFNPIQDQILNWGFEFHFVLPLALLLAAYWAAISLPQPRNYIVTAILASAAAFSMAVGLVSWALILPLLLLRERLPGWKKWLAIWSGAFAFNVVFFFIGYLRPPVSEMDLLQRFPEVFRYYTIYLGSAFAPGRGYLPLATAGAIGTAILVAFVGALGILWFRRKDASFIRHAIPWLMVSVIGLTHDAMTTAGRFHLGPIQAMETRYIIFSVMVPIGLLVFGAMVAGENLRAGHRWPAGLYWALALALMTLHVASAISYLGVWPASKHLRLLTKSVVQTIDIVDQPELLARVSPKPEKLRETAHALNRLGYLQPGLLTSAHIRDIGDPLAKGSTLYGVIETAEQHGDWMTISGFSILPDRVEIADAVLLTYEVPNQEPVIFAIAEVIEPRPDIVAASGVSGFERCGWRRIFSTVGLPGGMSRITAWAYDAERRRAWRLAGTGVARR